MAGFSTRHGIPAEAQLTRIADIITQVETDAIRTVRLGFADHPGVVPGTPFAAAPIGSLFVHPLPAPPTPPLKDLAHRTVLPVWNGESTGLAGMAGIGDILLIPDPDRFHILPWMRDTAWLQADIFHTDGNPSPLDTRGIARRANAGLVEAGLQLNAGLEIEAHVYRLTDRPLNTSDIGHIKL